MKHNLNVKSLLTGYAARLRYVRRFQTCRVGIPETVAEHSYYTVLYALLVGHWCEENSPAVHGRLDLRLVAMRATLHDLEEARSGDFPRAFKHSTPELKKALDLAGSQAIDQVLAQWTDDRTTREKYRKYWAQAKDDATYEGRIVAFADFLSSISHVAQEVIDHNLGFLEHVADIRLYYEDFQRPAFDFCRPLVDEVGQFLEELFNVD